MLSIVAPREPGRLSPRRDTPGFPGRRRERLDAVAVSRLPTAVPTSETVLANEPGALPLLVVCLALLLALTLGILAARQRWSGVRVWVIASAPAIALAWFTTDVVMRLLPNLM